MGIPEKDDFEKTTRILICDGDDGLESDIDYEGIDIPASIIRK